MASFNKVILVGNLTRDPELRYTPKGTAVAKIGLAVNRTWRNEAGETKEEVTFVDVDVFGRTAENVGQYLRKGSQVYVEGSLRTRKWTDKDDHEKYTTEIRADQMQMLGSRPAASGQGGGDAFEREYSAPSSTPSSSPG